MTIKNIKNIQMKKFLILPALSLVFITILSSCFKDKGPSCINNTLERDKQVIDSFLTTKGLTAAYTYDSQTGMYYTINDPGSGSPVTLDSLVAFKFEGKLLNDTKFAEGSVATATNTLQYYSGIYAYTLQKINEGGSITLIIPSSLAYGCNGGTNASGQLVVPANAQIIYTFWLTDVKSH